MGPSMPTSLDLIYRALREFRRYTGDGLPGEPINAPLPVGDPQSGVWNPKKAELREAFQAAVESATDVARLEEEVDTFNAKIAAVNAGIVRKGTWAELLARPGTTSGQPGEVVGDGGTHTDPVVGGTVPNDGSYAWSTSPAGWQWVSEGSTRLDEVNETGTPPIFFSSEATGVGAGVGSTVFAANKDRIEADGGFAIQRFSASTQEGIWVTDEATGLSTQVAAPPVDPLATSASAVTTAALFVAAQYAYVQGRSDTEALRLNSQDVSGYAGTVFTPAALAKLRIGTGQSFMAGAALARLFMSASRLALWSAQTSINYANRPCFSVGPDSRCVQAGPVYVPFNGGDLDLYPLVENFIEQTGTDTIRSAADIAAGSYDDNERGGTPETVRDVLFWVLHNRWLGLADDAVPTWFSVAMNHAKTDGSIAEVGTGDGLARMQSLIEVFNDAITAKGDGDAVQCDVVDVSHGEADEAAATATYAADWQTFRTAILAKLSSELGQSAPPAFLMQQVGGARYGTSAMVAANAQVAMMLDITGASAGFHLVGCKYEVPHFYFQDAANIPGFPSAFTGNGHPTLAGNVLMGIRSAVALHYLQDRQENYWVPFPYECFYEGKNFLLSIPAKFGPIREVEMVNGVQVVKLANLGITFENGGGSDNPVTWARVVPGYSNLVEGVCASEISSYTTMKMGERTGTFSQSGFTNIRDSFDLSLPFDLPFDRNQIVHAEGYVDSPLINDLGRFLEDIPGWVGKPDLGNPCARRTITATQLPPV